MAIALLAGSGIPEATVFSGPISRPPPERSSPAVKILALLERTMALTYVKIQYSIFKIQDSRWLFDPRISVSGMEK